MRLPQLKGFGEDLHKYLEVWSLKSGQIALEAEELVSRPQKLKESYIAIDEELCNLERKVAELDPLQNWKHKHFLSQLCPRLRNMIETTCTRPEGVEDLDDSLRERKDFKPMIGMFQEMAELPLTNEYARQTFIQAADAVEHIRQLSDASSTFQETILRFNKDSSALKDRLDKVLSNEIIGCLYSLATSHKTRLIEAITRTQLTPYVDPFDPRADTVSVERWMPQKLRSVCRGLTVNDEGELCRSDVTGNPAALVRELAHLIEQGDTELFSNGKVGRRLAPVIRAALPMANELALSAAEARRVQAEEALLLERLQAEADKQARDFVQLVFNEIMEAGNSLTPSGAENARILFHEMYRDASSIEARQNLLREFGISISVPCEHLLKQLEVYLLSPKDLDKWLQQVRQIRLNMVKSENPADHLAWNDLSNFLPSKLRGS